MTGDLRNASALIEDVRRAEPELTPPLRAAVTAAFLLLNGDGDVDTAHRLLVRAIEDESGEQDLEALEDGLHTLMVVCYFGGRAELWKPFHAAIARMTRLPEALYLSTKTYVDPVRGAAPALGELDAAIARLAEEVDPVRIMRISFAGAFVDRLGPCRAAFWRVVRDGREGGAIASAIDALILLGLDDLHAGQWDHAKHLLEEATALCERHGYRLLAWPSQYLQALIAAGRGEYETTGAATNEMTQWAAPRGIGAIHDYASHARALAALGQGDFEQAYRQASAISPAGTFAPHVQAALFVMMDLVESAVHTGREVEATAHVTAMREANIGVLSPRLALLSAGSAAIAAPDAAATELFDRALALPIADRWPFDLARVQLAYGERLRRLRVPATESRVHLTAALETFERLGARPWSEQSRHRASRDRADQGTWQRVSQGVARHLKSERSRCSPPPA